MKQGWTYKKLGEIATSMYRGSGIRRDQVTTDGIPCVRYGEIYTTYNISFNECVSHTQESFVPNPKYFEHGDLLFAITGESVEDIGKTIAYMGKEKCMLGGDIICMKHNENPKYLSYALSTPDAIRQKGLGKTKLKVVHTNAPSLQSIKIPLPSPAEQERIVERLDAAFAQIDELKSNAEKQLAEARALFQSALTQAMQPKPGWQEKKLSDICDVINGLWKGKKPPYIKVGVIRNANFTKSFTLRYDNIEYLDVEVRQYEKRKLQKGDLIVEKSGGSEKQPVGRAVLFEREDGEFSFSNFTSILRIKDKNTFLSKFLYYFLLFIYKRGDTFGMQRATTGIHNIEFEKYLSIGVPVLSLSEQQCVVDYLDALSKIVCDLEEISRKTAAECDAMKQALLRQIFE